jgi:ABC-type molybdate transport system substrate-binding protein
MCRTWLAGLLALTIPTLANAETVHLYAAGSLRTALTEAARAFEANHEGDIRVELEFGASGLLRERIEAGAPADVFASADVGHPARLARSGRTLSGVVVFARNRLCALVRDGLKVTPATLLETMLEPQVRVGTSTPKADPSGDYAFALFAKADTQKPGARGILESKALPLTGGPASEKPPAGQNQYGWIMSSGQADIFLTYCTNAVLAHQEVPALQIVQIPAELNVEADYGLVVMKNAPASASNLAAFIRGEPGQSILVSHGFARGDPP